MLSADEYCVDCLMDGAHSTVHADSYRGQRAIMKELALNAVAGKCEDADYYVSKTWYCSLFLKSKYEFMWSAVVP